MDIPNPVAIQLHSELKSLEITTMLAILFNRFIEHDDRFLFLLIRSLEQLDSKLLMEIYKEKVEVLDYFQDLLLTKEFWISLIGVLKSKNLWEKFIHQIMVYGVTSIVDTLLICHFHPEQLKKISVLSNLIKFDKEYDLLNHKEDVQKSPASPSSIASSKKSESDTLAKEKFKLHKLQEDLSTKNKKYNDLLNNYKQLNEERFSDEAVIRKLKLANAELQKQFRTNDSKLNTLLSNFEVIKINNDKNREIDLMNDDLRADIERLTGEIAAMKKKMKKK
ncbi:unnamed protein product [Ambrosiozyma monospora]|uniref:Unnamed protein product n=1 Tax=Ambrosiozyma monospora TaxID=43982 RepID=A0A9W6YVB3_AMBMO|nr:unnamed protein product [Ambrosiozyma monospora]